MGMCIGSYNSKKIDMLRKIKTDKDIIKYSSECISYYISKEEMDKDLSKYKNKKGFIHN